MANSIRIGFKREHLISALILQFAWFQLHAIVSRGYDQEETVMGLAR